MTTGISNRFSQDDLIQELHARVPISGMMGIEVRRRADGIELSMPLEPNINHAGTQFGGSLASLGALTGFSALSLMLRDSGISARVLITACSIRFRRPVTGTALCVFSGEQYRSVYDIIREMRPGARERIQLQLEITSEGRQSVTLDAEYAVIRDQD